MPIAISFSSSGPNLLAPLTETAVSQSLAAVCERSVRILERMLREELAKHWRELSVSQRVRTRYPVFTNLNVVLERYQSCFEVSATNEGAELTVSSDKLIANGFPSNLPTLLEFGSEDGVSPVAHMRTAWYSFTQDVLPKMAREIMNELT